VILVVGLLMAAQAVAQMGSLPIVMR
jgi:hypothetical protein